jgi:sarcosine oxidase, subunit gamma
MTTPITTTTTQAGSGPVSLSLLPESPRYSLRIGPADIAAASDALGLKLPNRPGQRAAAGSRSALCLGPDEWVLYTDEADAPTVEAAFAAIYPATPHSLISISDRERTITLSGPQAAELLSTSCPRDLSAIASGTGTRTVFDTVQIILLRDSETDFHIDVGRSYLPHVWALLERANQELAAGL